MLNSPLYGPTDNGPASQGDFAKSVAVDRRGNTIVTGLSLESSGGTNHYNMTTIKYASQGPTATRLWTQVWRGENTNGDDAGNMVQLDNDGNVYVAGYSQGPGSSALDFVVVRFRASDGFPEWTYRYDGPDFYNEEAVDIAVDEANGFVYATGRKYHPQSAQTSSILTVKIDINTGAQVFAKEYDGAAGGDDYGVAIAHNGGEIYVTGVAYENSASDVDWVTIKYKGDGTLIWDEFVQGEDVFFKEDKPVDIAVDSRSFIWVTGYILRNDGSNPNYATISYDGDGGIRWGPIEYSNITNGGNDKATALALQRNNVGHGVYVFVTGLSESAAFGLDYATLRYPADGAVTHAWAARYPGAGADEAFAISVAGNGNTYVAGRSFINGNGYDYLTLRYRLDGSQVNLPTSWHEGFGDDEAHAIASSCAGLTHVTGWVTNNVDDYKTFKYAQTTAQTASPSTVIVGPGSIISPPPPGELAAIQSSDDVRLVCRPGAILVEGQFPLVITVTGTSPISVPTEMCLQVEAHTSVANLLQVIEFFDFQNMVWRKIDERKGTPGTDSVVHADAKYDPSVFVQVATNQVQARIKYIALGSVLIYPWFARIDLVKWEILD